MAESSIDMKFTAKTADAQKRIEDLEKEVSRLNGELNKTNNSSSQATSGLATVAKSAVAATAVVAAVAAAFKAVVSASKECIEAYKKQEQAETRLQAVLKATGNQIGMTAGDLKELASATQSITRFGDEAILEAEKVLVATQALDKEGLQRAIAASADLAEAMGTDITSAAQTMAYALQDPEQGLTRLRRQGIAFTDEEIAQVKALQDANDLFGAQALVLDKIESKYKGVAQAVASTPTGTLDKIKNVWGDLKQDLGGYLMNSLGPFFNWLYGKLSDFERRINEKMHSKEILQHVVSGDSQWLAENTTNETLKQELSKWETTFTSYLLEGGLSGNNYGEILRGMDIDWQKIMDTPLTQIQAVFTDMFGGVLNSSQLEELVDDFLYWEDVMRDDLRLVETLRTAVDLQNNILDVSDYTGGSGSGTTETGAAVADAKSAIQQFLSSNSSGSSSYKVQQYQAIIATAKEYLQQIKDYGGMVNEEGDYAILSLLGLPEGTTIGDVKNMATQLEEIIADCENKIDEIVNPKESQGSTAASEKKIQAWIPVDYLNEYNETLDHLTTQIWLLNKQIAETTDPAVKQYLENIRDGLEEERVALTEVKEEAKSAWQVMLEGAQEFLDTWESVIDRTMALTGAVVGFMSQMWTQQADDLERALERDKAAGDMSEQEEAERLSKINDLREKSFNAEKANSITNALINGALAVTKCLSELGPVAGPVAASLVTATTALQVATIANQQYTPMAKGGIVTQATPIIAGEAGPEAIIPLSGGRAKQYLDGSGGVIINITVQGNADEDVIFHAIERAQRTGYLPNWQYT